MRHAKASGPARLRLLAAIVLLAALPALPASPARGDVGVESASHTSGAPGDVVTLTLGCGFCFPPCVGEPGHRHPPGVLHGTCMLGTQARPPPGFQIWLTPLRRSLAPYRCGPGDSCAPGSSRPPHLPSFIYLGRAKRDPGTEPGDIPRYRLRFQVPPARAGRYEYVIYCDACVAGPRGSLIDDRTTSAGRLQVLPPDSSGATASGAGAGPWIVGGAAVAIMALALRLLLRRNRATGPRAGPAS